MRRGAPPAYVECPDVSYKAIHEEAQQAAATCLTYTEFRVLQYKQERGLTIDEIDDLLKKDPLFNPAELCSDSTRTLQGLANKATAVEHREIDLWKEGDGNQTLVLWLRTSRT